MTRLEDLHRRFRDEDRTSARREERRRELESRLAGQPEAQPQCPEAIRHDPHADGSCRWCGKAGVGTVLPRADFPYDQHGGTVLVNEAWEYFRGEDEADLPRFYTATVHERPEAA